MGRGQGVLPPPELLISSFTGPWPITTGSPSRSLPSPGDGKKRGDAMDIERMRALEEAFRREASESFKGMFGEDGQNGLITFREREERALGLGLQLARWLLGAHLGEDPLKAPHKGETLCPHCHQPAKPREGPPEGRDVVTKMDGVNYERQAFLCVPCRRVFFPSGPQARSERGGLQSFGSPNSGVVGGKPRVVQASRREPEGDPQLGSHATRHRKRDGKARR